MNTDRSIIFLVKEFHETKVVLLSIPSVYKTTSRFEYLYQNEEYIGTTAKILNFYSNGYFLMANVEVVNKKSELHGMFVNWPVMSLHIGDSYTQGSIVNSLSKKIWSIVFGNSTKNDWKPLFYKNECVGILSGLKCKFCNARGNLSSCNKISDEDKKKFVFRRTGKGLYTRTEVRKIEDNDCNGVQYDANRMECKCCSSSDKCRDKMVSNEPKEKLTKEGEKYRVVEKTKMVGQSCPTKEQSEKFFNNQTPEERFNMQMFALHLARHERLNEKVHGKYTRNLRSEGVNTKDCDICGTCLPKKAEYCCSCGKDQTKVVCRIPNCDGIIYTSYIGGKLIPVCTRCGVTQVIDGRIVK